MANSYAGTESVAVAWLKSLGLTQVATTVPEDHTTWYTTGIVQVEKTGAVVDPFLKLRSNVITCHVWAARQDRNAQNPPWNQANQIAELISDACYDSSKSVNIGLTLPASLGSLPVKVLSAWLIQDPTRAPSDEQFMAHYVLDLQISWVQLPAN
ncbi:hypothetical protein [Streptomyces prunicolor]|uniref:hypothetical protein n=1 Tax=Streptomyces prunicolor TaxID=67348 RepID=UPI001319D30C|nr:hypothetical protein [Streptomyces prunicolor]